MPLLSERLPRLSAAAGTAYRTVRFYVRRGSGRAYWTLLEHLLRSVVKPPVMRYVRLGLTHRCQCDCMHCYARGRAEAGRPELSLEECKSVLDQARRLGLPQITFTGGEPLLRDDTVELVRDARELGLVTRINTNGALLDRRRVAALKRAGLSKCCVSIDDADPDTHDRLRRLPGLHARARQGLRNLREAGILSEIITYASRRGGEEGVRRIMALGRQLGVTSVFVLLPFAMGAWEGATDELLNETEKAALRRLQSIIFAHLELPTASSPCCVVRRSAFYVSPYGDVAPCPLVPFVMGNVRQHALETLWQRYCEGPTFDFRGDCAMNDQGVREALRRHIEAVAASLAGRPPEAAAAG